ncbi:bi-domain-containing oxidoreductase [Pseudohalioglobus lutimaris]|uniref:Oxidoreductase n=1 Tax=Pseudohalioglobus lutimaris TaxID=1737061 RepID=A0A2N5WXT7_9GAMM|nr:bi-domain-containing oxidoreductase [Pseudohalioglobus lutimaris]PLW67038.1 oxidoreductase [Pseudohalioglobus lutimaris]
MRQISQNYKNGTINLETVNTPKLKSGGILVQTHFSAISMGTEGMKIREGGMSMLGKARARPDQVKKVIESVQQQGLKSTYEKVMNKLDSLTPLGYSISGTVLEVGKGAEEFQVGQRVACAGVGYANHAEINFVPKNLVVPVPKGVRMEDAAFTTICSIAMQGFRQSEMQLGETACVIGLGLIGQILVQILTASGINVIGIDLVQERCELAELNGAFCALQPQDERLMQKSQTLTDGLGIDCTFIAAGGSSNGPVEIAHKLARDRGRLVDIGKTKLDLPWNDYYEKELDVRFARSYGPGRYDSNYEEGGIDYPVGYVRWTERRNMQSVLRLMEKGSLDMRPLIGSVEPFDDAERVLKSIGEGERKDIAIAFRHNDDIDAFQSSPNRSALNSSLDSIGDKVKVIAIGAGNYASSMLLPHLAKNPNVILHEVVTATSLSAMNAMNKFGFSRSSTSFEDALLGEADAAIITTRHQSHALMVSAAIKANKAVYVEKPLAIDLEGLASVDDAVRSSANPRLMVGFNRRFSPLMRKVKDSLSEINLPMVMNYRVHAGQLEEGSWYLKSDEHGSRFEGEAGHFFDVFAFLTNSRPLSVFARCLRPPNISKDDLDNLVVTVQYEDGSIGNLLYLTQGNKKVPKESLEVFCGGTSIQLHNFESMKIYSGDKCNKIKARSIDKGQKNELLEVVSAIKAGSQMPISIDCLFDTTLATLASTESLRRGEVVCLSDFSI